MTVYKINVTGNAIATNILKGACEFSKIWLDGVTIFKSCCKNDCPSVVLWNHSSAVGVYPKLTLRCKRIEQLRKQSSL